MVRGLTIGCTDYRGQSLQDILVDLENWIKSLNEVIEIFDINVRELDIVGYWKSVDYNFRASCNDLKLFFRTAISDIQEVINGINSEIKEYHVRLVANLGENALEKYENHRKIWRENEAKEYGEENFKKVERLYGEGSDMTGDMFDLNNLAPRLKDFVGMAKQNNSNSTSSVNVNNHFHSTVTGIQQNYDSKEIQQIVDLNTNREQTEEIKTMLKYFKEYLEQSTSEQKEEVLENVTDLEEVIEQEKPKKSRVKAFGNSISAGLQKMLKMKTFSNIEEIGTKLPKMIDNFNDLVDKF